MGIALAGGRGALFNDPGTLWHLRLGREILTTGTVPRCDTLTFTRSQSPWVDQSWAFDALLAGVVDCFGWSAVIAIVAIALAWLYSTLARGLIDDGFSPVVAMVVAILSAAMGCIHFLVRPHLFTFGFVFLALRACRKQHREGGWSVFLVPVYTTVLANLHGGFLALPLILATAGVGHAISGELDRARRCNLSRFGLALVAACFSALANPYGFGLYRHVGHLLISSGVTSLIIEYQPAPFGKPEAKVLEWALLALVGLPVVSARRIERYELAHVLVWLHLALTSIRNAPFFALASATALATLLDGLPILIRRSWKSDERTTIWPASVTLSLLIIVSLGGNLGGFDYKKWPFSALDTLNHQPTTTRMFHEQDWGGLIAAECQPMRRSYLDDRFELFGKEAILEYIEVLTGGPSWDVVRDRDKIEIAWLRPDRGLAKRLLKEPRWQVLHRDKVSILFKQVEASRLSAR
jgi:hypothetical protein